MPISQKLLLILQPISKCQVLYPNNYEKVNLIFDGHCSNGHSNDKLQ